MRRLAASLALLLPSCTAPAVSASPTPVPSALPVVELKYRVFDQVGRPWYCDPDFYPVARADETELARQRFPEMQRDAEAFAAILRHNGVPTGAAFSVGDDQLLAIYRDWKDLERVPLDRTGPTGVYGSAFLVRPQSASKAGERVELRIDAGGRITVLSRTQAGPPNCPICLADTTMIDTPSGPVRVVDLRRGDIIWTLGMTGSRVAAQLVAVGDVEAPADHEVLRIALRDGRAVTGSDGHPTADGRPLRTLSVGDALDGSTVTSIERLPYRGRTYDVLPAGPTGAYWADGVLLASTLRR